MNQLDWLSQLIAFDTTSRNSNLELIHFINDWLSDRQLHTRLTYSANREKANLLATLPAVDGSLNGGLVLSGHTDVVPVDGQLWDTSPFSATRIKDRIYGRGACDMKGFIAVVLALIPEFQKYKLRKPLHLAFSYDEEVGCLGASLLIEDLVQNGSLPEACLVGEPTKMRLIVAHKGIQAFRCRVEGYAVHSSLTPSGCNALEYAAELVSWIRKHADQLRITGPSDPCYDVPFTTISVNQIQGGNALNIVPATCEFSFEFRNLPSVSPKQILSQIENYIHDILLPKMRQGYSKAAITIEPLSRVPSFEAIEDTAFIDLTRALTQTKDKAKVAYATEAGLFQKAGIPTLLCGPGSIEQAHQPNEFVSLEQLDQCKEFLEKLVKQFLT